MKKIMVLAVTALFAISVSAQTGTPAAKPAAAPAKTEKAAPTAAAPAKEMKAADKAAAPAAAHKKGGHKKAAPAAAPAEKK